MNTALITGGSKGFGLALAESLVADGWSVVIDGRNPDALDEAVTRLRGVSNGQAVRGIVGDVADPNHRDEFARAVGDDLDLLVNNASTLGPSPQPNLAEYPLDDLREVYEGRLFYGRDAFEGLSTLDSLMAMKRSGELRSIYRKYGILDSHQDQIGV